LTPSHPCSTPVLATLLAYVSGTRDPVQGGGLLLAYTTGYVTPLLVAATVAVGGPWARQLQRTEKGRVKLGGKHKQRDEGKEHVGAST